MILINRMFTSDHYSGYSRPNTNRAGILRPSNSYNRSTYIPPPRPPPRKTSQVKVKFDIPDKRTTRRTSKTKTKRSPRSSLIRHIRKGFRRSSRRKYTNKYARALSEFAYATSPFFIALAGVMLYHNDLLKKHEDAKKA